MNTSDSLITSLTLMKHAPDMVAELERDLITLKIVAGKLELGTLAERTVRIRIRNLHAFLEHIRKECAA